MEILFDAATVLVAVFVGGAGIMAGILLVEWFNGEL
jgi:hypothetical protein